MPTETVCGKWAELQKAIQNLLDLKKHADKLEHESKVKRSILQKAAGSSSSSTTTL